MSAGVLSVSRQIVINGTFSFSRQRNLRLISRDYTASLKSDLFSFYVQL